MILVVEHGEDTDDLEAIPSMVNLEFAAKAMLAGTPSQRSKVVDFGVRVDLPECFVLDSENTH